MTLQDVTEKLTAFATANKDATIEAIENQDGHYRIKKLFNDGTVNLNFKETDNPLFEALNRLTFPERFSAIWHRDTNRFEVIYTIFTPTGDRADIATRKFEFTFRGQTYKCSFDKCSEDLMTVAGHFTPEGVSESNHRNLVLFAQLAAFIANPDGVADEQRTTFAEAAPISFWVDGIQEWNDEQVQDLVHHLNFYMSYYDRLTPTILVHTPPEESRAYQPQMRLPFTKFPEQIRSIEIDRDLLHFWHASRIGDPMRRFIHSYQILEYAAFYMIEEDIERSIVKLLSAPNATTRASDIAAQIMDRFGTSKLSDPQKIEHLFRKVVAPEMVWEAMEPNREAFSEATEFEGGYTAPALLKKDWKLEDFTTNWPVAFANTMRNMRNALSHGREQRMTSVITPTGANRRKLQAWVPPLAAAAREVMVYRNV